MLSASMRERGDACVPAKLLAGHDPGTESHTPPVLADPSVEELGVGELSLGLPLELAGLDDAPVRLLDSLEVFSTLLFRSRRDPVEDLLRFIVVALRYQPARGLGKD